MQEDGSEEDVKRREDGRETETWKSPVPLTMLATCTFLLIMELRTTQGRPLSWSGESWEGSWKMNTVVTSVAEGAHGGVCVCVCVCVCEGGVHKGSWKSSCKHAVQNV